MKLEEVLLKPNKKAKSYIEEKNIVYGTIVNKKKNSKQITGVINTIGYILPNNTIYDFISKNVFELYNIDKLEQEGIVFLFSHQIFKKSNRKISLKSYNSTIQPLIDDYIKTHYALNEEYNEYLENTEYIPTKKYIN